jgi:hypothetical protein
MVFIAMKSVLLRAAILALFPQDNSEKELVG